MKKIILYFPFFILFAFYSCSDEPIDSAILNGIDNGGSSSGGGNNGGNQNTEPSTGDYWPMATGNNWEYDVTTDNQPQSGYTMNIADYVNYNGQQQYIYSQFMGGVTATDGTQFEDLEMNVYSRKEGGNYIVTAGDMSFDYMGVQFTQTGYEYTILKDYLEVGETWSTSYSTTTSVAIEGSPIPDQVTNTTVNLEIIDKDFNMTVNGVEYGPIIQVKMVSNSISSGLTVQSEADYYFARDIGPVKIVSTSNDVADGIVSTSIQELTSFSLN